MKKTFEFHWFDGKKEIGKGNTVAEAFTSLGYSLGAMSALDYFQEQENCEFKKITSKEKK